MSNNLFVLYDLHAVGQNYDAVVNAIKSLGSWAKVQQSVWYVDSPLDAKQAAKKLRNSTDHNDSLIVLDTTNNGAFWYNLSDEVAAHIQNHWSK